MKWGKVCCLRIVRIHFRIWLGQMVMLKKTVKMPNRMINSFLTFSQFTFFFFFLYAVHMFFYFKMNKSQKITSIKNTFFLVFDIIFFFLPKSNFITANVAALSDELTSGGTKESNKYIQYICAAPYLSL